LTLSIRICVVGNSFVGAVLKGFEESRGLIEPNNIGLFAAAGHVFNEMEVREGRVCGAQMSRAPSDLIAYYDVIFVYAIFPSPHQVALTERSLLKSRYSGAVVHDAIEDMLVYSDAWRMRSKIIGAGAAHVIVLSRNIGNMGKKLDRASYERGMELINSIIGPRIYLPFPDRLLNEDASPKGEYYKAGLNVHGMNTNLGSGRNIDVMHLNSQGGRVVLESMIERAVIVIPKGPDRDERVAAASGGVNVLTSLPT
jgi:hypothetical protein